MATTIHTETSLGALPADGGTYTIQAGVVNFHVGGTRYEIPLDKVKYIETTYEESPNRY